MPRGVTAGTGGAIGKFKYRVNLFPRDVGLVDNFLDAGSGSRVFEHGGEGHSGIAKNPRAA
jgi:hypothetical protein